MTPTSEQELAEAIASAGSPLSIRGGGTHPGHVAGDVLDTTGLRGISLYEPGALTMIAQAGTPLSEIQAALDNEQQDLAFEPDLWPSLVGDSTIGGILSGNISGPRRIQAGACRDALLGLRFVDGNGTVLKNGGRVMKNVTGYDLVRLLAGSWGRLGVITEVALKLRPKPETQATLILKGLKDKAVAQAMSAALGSPFEITGAAHVPARDGAAAETALRIEGFESSVSYRMGELSRLFSDQDIEGINDPAQSAALWSRIGRLDGLPVAQGALWRISCKPSDGPTLVHRLDPIAAQYDWGGGLIWAVLPEDVDARASLGTYDGHASLIRGVGFPMVQPEPAPLAQLTDALVQKFDPRGILNKRAA